MKRLHHGRKTKLLWQMDGREAGERGKAGVRELAPEQSRKAGSAVTPLSGGLSSQRGHKGLQVGDGVAGTQTWVHIAV